MNHSEIFSACGGANFGNHEGKNVEIHSQLDEERAEEFWDCSSQQLDG